MCIFMYWDVLLLTGPTSSAPSSFAVGVCCGELKLCCSEL